MATWVSHLTTISGLPLVDACNQTDDEFLPGQIAGIVDPQNETVF